MGRKVPENAAEWLERYEQRYRKAFDNYQSTGDPKYDRQVWEYDNVCEAFRALLEARDQRDEAIRKRLMSKKWVVDRLVNPSYSKTEVIKMLDDAVYW